MRIASMLLLIAMPALTCPSIIAGQLYRWTDAQGRTHFSDQPPPPGTKNYLEQKLKSGSKAVAEAPKVAVTLYVTPTCGKPCDDAKTFLSRRGIPHAIKNPSTDATANQTLRASGGTPQVPTLMLDNDKLEGFSESAWNYALNKAGFPKIDSPDNQSGDKNSTPAKP